VALSEKEHKTDKLFEPAGRVFGRRVVSLAPQARALSYGQELRQLARCILGITDCPTATATFE